jgi:predicted phage gp36 major capsid-like protein
MPKASQRILDDSAFDVEGWLAEKIATRFIRAEAAAFINGDGVDKPKGILLPTKVANASWTWGSLGFVTTGAAADFARDEPGGLPRQPGLCAGRGLPGERDLPDELAHRTARCAR